jgi:hypothetical protein
MFFSVGKPSYKFLGKTMTSMNRLFYALIGGFILLVIVFLFRERSWKKAFIQKDEKFNEKQGLIENLNSMLEIEKENNKYNQYILNTFIESCVQNSNYSIIKSLNETETSSSSLQIIENYQEFLQHCFSDVLQTASNSDSLFSSLTKANNTPFNDNNNSTSSQSFLENHHISLHPHSLFDRVGFFLLLFFLSLFLSESFLLYNFASSSSDVILTKEGKKLKKSDFIEKPLYQQLQLYLLKDHPISSFLFFSCFFLGIILLYFCSFFYSFSNLFYYFLFSFFFKILIFFLFSSFLSFLLFNGILLIDYLIKFYEKKNVFVIFYENSRKNDFWLLIGRKLFWIYNIYHLISNLLWFLSLLGLLFPCFYFFVYYDSMFSHSHMTSASSSSPSSSSSSLNNVNHFLLITWLHLLIPILVYYYLNIVTIIVPFVTIDKQQQQKNNNNNSNNNRSFNPSSPPSPPSPYQQILFSSSSSSFLRIIFFWLITRNLFLSDVSLSTAEEEEGGEEEGRRRKKSLQNNDMKLGLLVFLSAIFSAFYLLRFLLFLLFSSNPLTLTIFSWMMCWSFLFLHLFLLLLSLPLINILLYKYETIQKHRKSFEKKIKNQLESLQKEEENVKEKQKETEKEKQEKGKKTVKFEEKEDKEKLKAAATAGVTSSQIIEEEIRIGINIFDFALHKSILYSLFIHQDEKEKEKDKQEEEPRASGDGEEDNKKEDKNQMKLETIFLSFLQSDSYLFGKKFTANNEEGEGEENEENEENEEDVR